MSPDEARTFFTGMGKTTLTFFGYSTKYEDDQSMLKIARSVLAEYFPETTLVNIGGTQSGIGAIYPLAKSIRFTTTAIVSTLALEYPQAISRDVDHICFISDSQWGGNLPNSNKLSPTSQAMVSCSDILVGIGGGAISRDELTAGRDLGKPIHFYPAEINHEWLIRRAKQLGLPPPDSFWGDAHKTFGKKDDS